MVDHGTVPAFNASPFPATPFKPCLRFSRTRLNDDLLDVACAPSIPLLEPAFHRVVTPVVTTFPRSRTGRTEGLLTLRSARADLSARLESATGRSGAFPDGTLTRWNNASFRTHHPTESTRSEKGKSSNRLHHLPGAVEGPAYSARLKRARPVTGRGTVWNEFHFASK